MSKSKDERWIGWHFLSDDGMTRFKPRVKVRVGSVLRETGTLHLCVRGLHASTRAIDALEYAPGSIACLVELRGDRLDDDDKSCASERKCLAKIDATRILHEFACWCAERALKAVRQAGLEPDERSWNAIKTKRRWLAGKETDEELFSATSAACTAVWNTTWLSERSAFMASLPDAIKSAYWAAKWALRASERSSKESTAERTIQNRKLESMLLKAMGKR